MLPVLNNTRNTQDMRKKRKGLVPLCLSAVWAWDRIPCAWRLGLWPCGHSPYTALTAGKHRLVTGFRHPFPTSSPKNHASQLPEHKHNEQNDLLPKDHKSLNKLPSHNRNNLPSDWNSLSNYFQPLRWPGDDALPFQQLQELCTLSQVERDWLQFRVDLSDSGEKSKGKLSQVLLVCSIYYFVSWAHPD